MDIINHGVQGFLLGYIPTRSWIVGIVCSILGMLPDMSNYNYFHYDSKWVKYIPPIGLHLFLDKLSHGIDNRWYVGKWYEYFMIWRWKEMMWLESLTWAINIILIIITL